jgi:acetyl-CoA synthetase
MTRLTGFLAARQFLLETREDYEEAYNGFRWPELDEFNWALDWFDPLGSAPESAERPALLIVEPDGSQRTWTFAQMAARSSRVASWLRSQGVARGDRIVLMLGNQLELWETILAAMKLGAVIIPATTLLAESDLRDRVDRGKARHVVVASAETGKWAGVPGDFTRIAVGPPVTGWLSYAGSSSQPSATFEPDGVTHASDPLLLYFTSGTTAKPKLVEHTHASYPVGHLSTMYWIGLEPGGVHLNISSPGWAKHAWSNVFAPWNAGATAAVYNYTRFDAAAMLRQIQERGVTSFCAPPTVWRMLIQADLSVVRTPPAKLMGAGEPLNPEVIDQIEKAWGVRIRDGFGQTGTTVLIANSPGQPIKPGSMGRPMPGYRVVLLDTATGEPGDEGEICLDLAQRPLGLMTGYRENADRNAAAMAGGYYHTADVASRGEDGCITYVGRADDVFKASDYRISPFELESVLIEHPAVAEAAVVPAPDPIRLAVPKAYVVLAAGYPADRDTALSILRHAAGWSFAAASRPDLRPTSSARRTCPNYGPDMRPVTR